MSSGKKSVSSKMLSASLLPKVAPGSAPSLPGPRIATVILAAGESRRLGRPKALLSWKDQTLLEYILSQADGLPSAGTFVVLGAHAGEIQAACDLSQARVVLNEHWREGLSSSLRSALHVMAEDSVPYDAALILCSDQPALSADHLRLLIERYGRNGCEHVASYYSGKIGLPAVFDRSLFPDLARLKGDHGAESLFREARGRCCVVPFPGGALDIDTPEDYERLQRWDPLAETGAFQLGGSQSSCER